MTAHRSPGRLPELAGQAIRFGAIGVASTGAYVVLYSVLRPVQPAAIANAIALLVTTIGNTAANRRFTFRVRGRAALVHDHLAGLVGLAMALAITTAAIGLLDRLSSHPSRLVEVGVLVGANAIATICRFGLLRGLMARSRRPARTSIYLERTAS
ncbi:MAG TPA: GtrA family protein [Candidatus Limnocylindrales bacterium]